MRLAPAIVGFGATLVTATSTCSAARPRPLVTRHSIQVMRDPATQAMVAGTMR
jgi:hypothetical protein